MRFRSLLALAALLPALAGAEVNPKNGNYVTTMQDLVMTSPKGELDLRRTFNSKAAREMGWFGWGWSSPFETRLHPMPDGSVVIWENGTGLMHFYDPLLGEKKHEAGLDALVAAARTADRLDAKQAARLRARLHASEELRFRTALRLNVTGKPSQGDTWRSRLCGELELHKDVWRRDNCVDEPRVDLFSPAGRLVRSASEKQDYTLKWEGPRLVSVQERSGLSLQFAWNEEGRIASVTPSSGGEVRYTYSDSGDLVRSEDPRMIRIDYAYDNAHRLVRRTLIDTTKDTIAYNADGMVASTVDRVDVKTTYTYGEQGNRYWTHVQRFSRSGELEAERKFEYQDADSATGEHAVKRTVIREGEFEITMNADGSIQLGGPGVERMKREEEAARERVLRIRQKNEEAKLEAARVREEEIRKFNRCVVEASNLDHEEKQLKWNARQGNVSRAAGERQLNALKSRNDAFNRDCATTFQISNETARQLCSHPAWQSTWCDKW